MANSSKPRVQFDEFISSVRPDAADKKPLMFLQGYIGKSPSADSVRVYSDPSLNTFADVPTADIMHAQKATGDPLGGSMLWIKLPTSNNRAATAYLEGNLYGEYLKKVFDLEQAKPGSSTIVKTTDIAKVTYNCATDFTKPWVTKITDFTKVLASDFTRPQNLALVRYNLVASRGCPPWDFKGGVAVGSGYYY